MIARGGFEDLLRTGAPGAVPRLDLVTTAAAARRHGELLDDLQRRVDELRLQQNARHTQTLHQGDVGAVVLGAAATFLGALFGGPPPAPTRVPADVRTLQVSDATAHGTTAVLTATQQQRLLNYLSIRHVRGDDAKATRVLICVNGFMTAGEDPSGNWASWAPEDGNSVLYAVHWEAGDAAGWVDFLTRVSRNRNDTSALVPDIISNPWRAAEVKAEEVGNLLARVLAERPAVFRNRPVTLLGHSLGGAIVYNTLQKLAQLRSLGHLGNNNQERFVHSALLFAAAFVPTHAGRRAMCDETEERIVNIFSPNDAVLARIFSAVHPGATDAAGRGPLGNAGFTNIDVSDLVPPMLSNKFGHSYGQCMDRIRSRVLG